VRGTQLIEGRFDGDILPFARAAVFHLDRAGGEAARADNKLLRQADQVHCRKFGARGFVAVVVEHLDPGGEQFAVEVVGSFPATGIGRAQIDQADAERRDALRPDNPGIVVVRLDQRADET
jgi:hypothetical protein